MQDTLLNDFLDRRFILVTGKGGTGKSVLATALAMAISARGKRVLLTEMGRPKDRAFMRLHELIGLSELSHQFSHVVNPIEPMAEMQASRIDPLDSLLEYLGLKLHSTRLPALLLKNKITSSFLNVIPGLTELVCLGKLWHLASEKPNPEVDTIVLDAPASGHAMTLLNSPKNFAELTRIGPVFNDAIKMQTFLKDPKKLGVVYCTLPEEMPLQETREFCERFATMYTKPLVAINKLFPNWPQEKAVPSDHPTVDVMSYVASRLEREYNAVEAYNSSFAASELVRLPFCFSSSEKLNDSPAVQLAKYIIEGMGESS